MMEPDRNETMDWVKRAWLCQVGFYLGAALFFYVGVSRELGRPGLYMHFSINSAWLLVAALNAVGRGGWRREAVGLLAVVANAFFVPYAVYAYGAALPVMAMAGALYVIAAVAVTPLAVGTAVMLAGAVFAGTLHLWLPEFGQEELPPRLPWVAGAYLALAGVGFAWRVLVLNLYRWLMAVPPPPVAVQPAPAAAAPAPDARANEETELLREQIAVHIVELHDLISGGSAS